MEKQHLEYDFSFHGLKDTYDRYDLGKDSSGSLIVTDKLSQSEINNSDIINRVKFSLIWFKVMGNPIGMKVADYDYKTRYNNAFSEVAENIYDNMMKVINTQLIEEGDIDVLELVSYFEDNKIQGINELKELFSNERYVVALNRWFRMSVPDASFPKKSAETYKQALSNLNDKKTL